jgi:hypothetical protein
MTNFCTSCGAVLEPDTRFCVECATPVKAPEADRSPTHQVAPAPTRAPAETSKPAPQLPGREATKGLAAPLPPADLKSRISGMPLYVAIAAMAAVAIGGTGYWVWTQKHEADARARQVEETRAAEARRINEEAARREQELRQKLKDEENRRQRAEQDRIAAEARATQEMQVRRQAEAKAAAEAQATQDARRAAQDAEKRVAAAAASTTPSMGYEAAAAAFRRGDFRAALSACQGPAQAGDARCQFMMGILYVNGHVGTRSDSDLRIAAGWFGKAAQQNLAAAQLNLGIMQERGLGMPRDVNAARGWYQRAAAQGNASAKQALDRLANSGR